MFVFTVETVITATVFIILLLIAAYQEIKKYFIQKNCSHDIYRETSACDAICTSCSKNLGFIGTVRDEREKRKNNEHS